MLEIELKFQVPPAQREAVRRAVQGRGGPAPRRRLRAIYFDTADGRLAAAAIALRLRREGARWVQTLKASTAHTGQRLEHEVVLPRAKAQPRLDPQRHAGTPAHQRLAHALRGAADVAWVERCRTDIWRTTRMRHVRGGVVELALDEGFIEAGDRRVPVCELEMELSGGRPGVLTALARDWVQRHELWLDVRSKAQRGECLARGGAAPPARKAVAVQLDAHDSVASALQQVLSETLGQVLANAAEVAGDRGRAEHLHQLRVGLRRTRVALRLFERAAVPGVDPSWGQRLSDLFNALGGTRDRDVWAATLLPALREAGAPWVELPPVADSGGSQGAQQVLRSPQANLLWLELLDFAWGAAAGPASPPIEATADALRPCVTQRLQAWHRRLRKAAKVADTLDDEALHEVRKLVKRQRYAVEFCAALIGTKVARRYLRELAPLQETLGALNDLHVAAQAYEAMLAQEPRAGFVLGWLAARRQAVRQQAVAALEPLARATAPWGRASD
jgi:inorganic triphosphatase YgiF